MARRQYSGGPAARRGAEGTGLATGPHGAGGRAACHLTAAAAAEMSQPAISRLYCAPRPRPRRRLAADITDTTATSSSSSSSSDI